MILLLDLGNTSIDFCVCQERKPVCRFRTYSDKLKSEVEYENLIKTYLDYYSIRVDSFEGALLCSVVPSLTKRLQHAVTKILGKECMVVSKATKTGLAIRVDNPSEVGTDLIALALGAIDTYQEDCLVISMSPSCISMSIASKEKQFQGVSLIPGLRNSVEMMWNNSAQLMSIDLEKPNRMIGKNSKESMNSGVIYGYSTMIEGMAAKLEKEYGKPLKRLLTGIDSSIIKDAIDPSFEYAPYLIFEGLYDIYIKNNK